MTAIDLPSYDPNRRGDRAYDASWYGTLAVLVACIGVLIAGSFVG